MNLENLKETYLVSNTASFLYSGFANDEQVIELKNNYSQESLIEKFETITRNEINTIDELIIAYSLFVAIVLFDNDRTLDFLNSSGNINFEWFPELKNLYTSRFKSFNYTNLDVKDFKTTSRNIRSESREEFNNQTIEFV